MKFNLPGKTVAKSTTTLVEKTNAHKFTLPNTTQVAKPHSETTPKKQGGFALGNKQAPTPSSSQPAASVQPSKSQNNAIPKVSDEKFNLVEDAVPSLSDDAAIKFRDMLTMLADNIDNEGELQNVLKGTLEYLGDNPEVDAILTPEDRAVFVRAARKSYGITLVAKTTRKAKTTKSAAKVDELMDELADLDFSL